MNDNSLRELASEAGISVEWTDAYGERRSVSAGSLRAMLAAMDLACSNDSDIADARARLNGQDASGPDRPLITADAGDPARLPFAIAEGTRAFIEFEQGGCADALVGRDADGAPRLNPVSRVGYHRLLIGDRQLTLAVAPRRCWSVADIAPGEKIWGLTAQVHGLRRARDGGIGDFGGVAQLARSAAGSRADALSLSPTHALFAADDNHFTPYSPSSRLFHNILLADPAATFASERVARAQAKTAEPGELARLEAGELIDWPRAGRARKAMLRALFDGFRESELATPANPLAVDFARFVAAGGDALQRHATFEALHAARFRNDFTKWHWRDWPAELRDNASPATRELAAANASEIVFHQFAQWLVDRSLRYAQGEAIAAGMRIGLICDLAVGMNDGGSQAWSAPNDLLLGLSIGAPPDPLAPRGQNWGLTNFSPRALVESGFAPFLATLRAAFRHAGGTRIDHVMGVSRLWLTPEGMEATEGAYLAYPTKDLLRLIRLESRRHRAVVIGEDLGTVPDGMREQLAAAGLYGMRVLPFERHDDVFNPPDWYPANSTAMTSTHDTATTAGWWAGIDLETRARLDQLPPGQSLELAVGERARDRAALWRALRAAGATKQDEQPTPDQSSRVVDAAIAFVARTPADLVLLPLEDALGIIEQPNLPGTTNEHPNWRRRYPGPADGCLDHANAKRRLQPLAERR